MKLSAWGYSTVGLVRSGNEDAFGMSVSQGVFAVADGLGAHPEGQRASQIAVETICAALSDIAPQADDSSGERNWGALLVRALDMAHGHLVAASEGLVNKPPFLPMGSTAVALVIPPGAGRAYWVHAGDSRLYLYRGGAIRLLTADDTRYGQPYRERDQIDVDLPHTNELLQALGTQGELDMLVGNCEVLVEDIFLLCTDGVSGMLTAPAIAAILVTSEPLQVVGRALIEAAMQKGGHDNATLVLVHVAAD